MGEGNWKLRDLECMHPIKGTHLNYPVCERKSGSKGLCDVSGFERMREQDSLICDFLACPVLGHITAFSKAVVGCVPVGISVCVCVCTTACALSSSSGTENAFWASPRSLLRRWQHTTGSVAFFLGVEAARRHRQEVNIPAGLIQSCCNWPVQISSFS